MTALLRRWYPGRAAMADARALHGRLGERAEAEARRRIVAGTADERLHELRYWTTVWSELMRVTDDTWMAG